MRFLLITLSLIAMPFAAGCNSALKCQRETALLRAEYLDLEDKYYALLAKSGSVDGDIVETISEEFTLDQGNPDIIYGTGIAETEIGGGEIVIGDSHIQSAVPTPVERKKTRFPNFNRKRNLAPESSPGIDRRPTILEDPSIDELPAPDSTDKQSIRRRRSRTQAIEAGFAGSSTPAPIVEEIVINKSASHGKNTDGFPGDDAINIVIQPKSADGKIVNQAGDLTVSITDPSADQGQQQIGYWTFLEKETALFFARDEYDNNGILLDLPWEDNIPLGKQLTVFVRFETPDGRVMATKTNLYIDPPAQAVLEDPQPAADKGWYKRQSNADSVGERSYWKPSR